MSTVQFFTPSALTRAESASPALAEREWAWGRFVVRLVQAGEQARLHGYPHCPLRPDQVMEHGSERYAVTWLLVRFDSMSPTQVYAVTVTSHATGHAVTFGQIIRKQRRRRATGAAHVRYNSPAGNHGTADEVALGLVAQAFPVRARPCGCTDGDRMQARLGCPSCSGTGRVG